MTIQNNTIRPIENEKILYVKGGNAVEEGTRLVPRRGSVLKGGPDQFLLAVLSLMQPDDFLRLATFGKEKKTKTIGNIELVEYALRIATQSKLAKVYYFSLELSSFIVSGVRYKPKVMLCGLDGPVGLAALICARLCGAKFIFSAHNALNLPQVSKLYKISNKLLVRFSDRIIVHGEFLAHQVMNYGVPNEKVFEYASTIDDHELTLINNQKKQEATNQRDTKTILFVGRMEEDKGIYDLLEAFQSASLGDAELLYIGDGEELTNIKNRVSENKIPNVRFLGQIPHAQVYQYLCSASVLVTPTQSRFPEGRCKSIVEAFIAGVPVIAPDYGPFPYLVRNHVNGLLYQADNIKLLTLALEEILGNPELLSKLNAGAAECGKQLLSSPSFRTALLKSYDAT